MRRYELMILTKPFTSEEFRNNFLPKLQKKIENIGGSINLLEFIGKKLLAYKIKNFSEGLYALFNLEIPPSKINDLKSYFNLNQDILRYLVVRLD
ncbi:MAG: 30S ribosomal protein S6 [Candidatus Dojkabacteria bacterium]|nr:30S ribosomal protein S6 [Candidatus Dojkabacteria bacterium]